MATMCRAPATPHQVGADGDPPFLGEAGFGSHPRESKHLASDRPPNLVGIEPPCLVSSPAPPPALAPAPSRAHVRKGPPDLRVNPKVRLAQAKRFAMGVLEHYNKKKKIKFELLDAKPAISIPEPRCCYTHINFTARSSKEDSQEQLFFAEILHKRQAPNRFIVTCCEPLDPVEECTVGQKMCRTEGTSAVRKNADFSYCFACTERILHPRGENYVAGHCNIPCVYDFVR